MTESVSTTSVPVSFIVEFCTNSLAFPMLVENTKAQNVDEECTRRSSPPVSGFYYDHSVRRSGERTS